jgi:hypothetical protein
MADQNQRDQYAAELARRFEEFTEWAIAHWPHTESPLLASDFEASRKELGEILGPKLGADENNTPAAVPDRQYVQVNPAPWP